MTQADRKTTTNNTRMIRLNSIQNVMQKRGNYYTNPIKIIPGNRGC